MEKYFIVDFHVVCKEISANNTGFAEQVDKKTISFVKVIPHERVYNRFMDNLVKFLKKGA